MNYHNVLDHKVYVQLAERSSKIVTAVYMISDFLESTDPLRKSVRENSTTIMQKLFACVHANASARVEILSEVDTLMYAQMSYLEVMQKNSFISEMNYTLINNEIAKLRSLVIESIKKSLPYDNARGTSIEVEQFTFRHDFFNAEVKKDSIIKDNLPVTPTLKDSVEQRELIKKTPVKQESVRNPIKDIPKPVKKKQKKEKVNKAKELRKDNILKIIKQKPNASINDICALFKDCSSKTIQRDLADLIDQGLVIKSGSRRWSTYNLSY